MHKAVKIAAVILVPSVLLIGGYIIYKKFIKKEPIMPLGLGVNKDSKKYATNATKGVTADSIENIGELGMKVSTFGTKTFVNTKTGAPVIPVDAIEAGKIETRIASRGKG